MEITFTSITLGYEEHILNRAGEVQMFYSNWRPDNRKVNHIKTIILLSTRLRISFRLSSPENKRGVGTTVSLV